MPSTHFSWFCCPVTTRSNKASNRVSSHNLSNKLEQETITIVIDKRNHAIAGWLSSFREKRRCELQNLVSTFKLRVFLTQTPYLERFLPTNPRSFYLVYLGLHHPTTQWFTTNAKSIPVSLIIAALKTPESSRSQSNTNPTAQSLNSWEYFLGIKHSFQKPKTQEQNPGHFKWGDSLLSLFAFSWMPLLVNSRFSTLKIPSQANKKSFPVYIGINSEKLKGLAVISPGWENLNSIRLFFWALHK